ncbi:MAG: peptidoglycan DD-metalloendopeptidase family protein [Anaerolineae bacterium]|nr:peptidoglycan DD-metalloendopeptidase family protein [Anaerolineae bacterium]
MPRLTSYTLRKRQRSRRLRILYTIGLVLLLILALGAVRLGLIGTIPVLSGCAAPLNPSSLPQLALGISGPSPTPISTTAVPTPASTNTPTPTSTSTPTSSPTHTPMPTTASTATPRPTATSPISSTIPLPTIIAVKPNGTPTITPGRLWPTPDPAQAHDHYWLERPIGPGGNIYASPWYPYGTDGHGQYLPHHGADLVNKEGTPVLAVAEADVVDAGSDANRVVGLEPNFYGNFIILRLLRTYHGQPVFVLYGHLSEIDVNPGERVQPHQPIGRVGMTGIALGPHLHIEVRVGKNDYAHTRNPELWLKPTPGYGTLAGRLLDSKGRAWANVPILIYRAPHLDRIWQQVYTYLNLPDINPDDDWGENFMLADMPVGKYRIEAEINGRIYRQDIEIRDGRTTFTIIRTVD